MKFGKNILNQQAHNRSLHYLDYKKLKKVLKGFEVLEDKEKKENIQVEDWFVGDEE